MSKQEAIAKGACTAGLEDCASGSFPRSLAVVIVFGFGLFYGVSTSSYLSAFASIDESFLFVPDIFFNVVVAASVVATAGTIVLLTVRGKLSTFSLPFWMPVALLIFANVAVFFNFFALLPFGLPLLIPGLIYGFASVILRLVWLEFFVMQKPSSMVLQIVLGFMVGAVISVVLQSVHASVQSILNCILLVVIGLCAQYARKKIPAALVAKSLIASPKPSLDRYKSALLAIGNAIIAFWVLEAVVGLLNSFMLAGQISFAGSGSVATFARFGALVVFCLFAFAVQRFPKISTFSRVVMPILAAMLVFLPFLSEGYSLFFNIMLLSSYYFIAMLITYLAVETARTHRISVYVPMGFAMMGTRMCLAVALIGGYSMGSLRVSVFGNSEDTLYFLMVIVVVIYVLSMAAVLLSRGVWRRKEEKRWFDPLETDLVETGHETLDVSDDDKGGTQGEFEQALDAHCSALAANYGLTEREAEIVALLARGRTKAHIAKTLFVSENTVRSHVRNIYTKLDVHTRQELIDLIEAQ